MTKLLVTGGGDQLATGGGVPLTSDASVVSLRAAAMVVAFGLAATASGVATAAVDPMPVTVSLSARASTKGGIEPMPIVFGMAAKVSATAALTAEPAPVTLDLAASPSGIASATVAPMPVAFDLTAKPTAANVASLRAAPMAVTFDLSARATRAADLRAAPMPVAFGLSATVSVNTGPKFRSYWLDAYARRQEVLNAIDANNRYLAKEAGDKAEAAANAVVLTNTRVDDVEDGIEAESLRITALTTRVGNAEGTIGTQGSAISALQTTSSSHAGTLSTHTSQISGLSASITDINGNVTNIANATSVLQTEVNSLGAAKALWGVYLDVNGHISGVQSINDGIVSEFNVAATVFRLLSPAGADGMEIRDGYIRIWKGASQTIIGNNFGQADQKLMRWFGPNIGAAACNKANATIWEDADGNAYFGGQVLQGVLRYFNSSTTVAFNTEVSTGNVASNSKPVAVTGQVQYARNQFYPGPGAAITLTTGSTSITAVIERRYGTGAWTELARATIPGADAVNNSGADASLAQYASGSLFATDVASSLNREYRTRVITRSVRQHTVTNPGSPVPAAVESQYQSIETME